MTHFTHSKTMLTLIPEETCGLKQDLISAFSGLQMLDMSFLSLRDLGIDFCPYFTSSTLKSLYNLKYLRLKGCDLDTLEYPSQLTVLSLEECPYLSNLPENLQLVSLQVCPSIKSLSALDTVEYARLDCPAIKSKEFNYLRNIKKMRVRGQIQDDVLSTLQTLEWLDIRYCRISDAALLHLKNIKVLYCEGTFVSHRGITSLPNLK